MKPLHDDQINNDGFMACCTGIWSDDVGRSEKSGVYDYFKEVSTRFNIPLLNHTNIPQSEVIFVGLCHLIESVFQALPRNGNYIIIHRTNDRPYLKEFDAVKPPSVKYVYTVDCRGIFSDVSAIPFGNASINGEDNLVKQIAQEEKRPTDKTLFVCYNTNPNTPHRNQSIPILKTKDFAFVYELEYPHKQMSGDEFYHNVRAHKFTMSLAGCGADASRQWSAIQLGSIPIVTDCHEMRHFEDLPMVYCPQDMNEITIDWLSAQDVSGKRTERMRMSYWSNHIEQKRKVFGI